MQFDFGKNWYRFSTHALDAARVAEAKEYFELLVDGIPLKGYTFIDIGFGQGLSLLTATEMGAHTTGVDINPTCTEVLRRNAGFYPNLDIDTINVITGSILDPNILDQLKTSFNEGAYDVVHSWGVLHHTGNMRQAISNAASLAKLGGYFVIAIYNSHWTSPIWRSIKWFFNKSPIWTQKLMIALFYPVIWIAKLIVTGKNPLKQERGMNFFYDIIDWLGGYPYEYATIKEVNGFLEELKFKSIRTIPAEVPTGCNQFVFQKTD
jgi:2-polyprenyl-6-hydroxyphenyl methylase/3-demethylubiquinone-9 3-methyltransferase